MAYIQGSAIAAKDKGSLSYRLNLVSQAIEEFVDAPVEILSAHMKHSFYMNESGQIMKATYGWSKGAIKVEAVDATDEIPIIADEDVPVFVASELSKLTESVLRGDKVSRTQVREISQLLANDEEYWISDVVFKINEQASDNAWYAMYEANEEKIRTDLYGTLREMESVIPTTRYSKFAPDQLSKLDAEMRESVIILSSVTSDIVDGCEKMLFDSEEDNFFCAVRESLKVEAQAVSSLLGKAEKLMRPKDMTVVAEAHDRLAERAKTMVVVSGYIKKRSRSSANEE